MSNVDKTIAEIALELKEPANRIRYLIQRDNLVSCRCIANARMYDEQAQARIKEALYNIRIFGDR